MKLTALTADYLARCTGPCPDELIDWAIDKGACLDGLTRARSGESLYPDDRRWLAERLPVEQLAQLAGDTNWYVRREVARRLPVELLGQLAGDPDAGVRCAVARRLGGAS